MTSIPLALLSAMRPRSRLLSKRRLVLPTITEGAEETVRDLNEANALHITGHSQSVSSEDYLLSICHLAHPTFPNRDVSPDNILTRQLEAVHRRPRLSRLSGATPATFEFHPTEEACATGTQEGEEAKKSGGLIFGNSDPLEYLYGHQNNLSGAVGQYLVEGRFSGQRGSMWDGQVRSRAHSIPCPSSPKLSCQRKSSCHELHISTAYPNIPPTDRFDGRRGSPAGRGAEGKRQNVVTKQSLISQWISDCRSAWREARVRACMLPAIAEI